jgi:RNase P/RNase MRP subunit p29
MQVQVERGEVVLVDGNDLVVKMEDGTIRHFPNLPESARATVDGKQLSIHDLKPGMKLQRNITTASTPQTVTTVQNVTGKVWHVTPPNSVILTLEDGTNQSFKIPNGQKFTIDGQQVDAFGLKKGMVVTATKIVEVPETAVSQHQHVSGTMPTPPQAPPADVPILVATGKPAAAPAPATAETAATAPGYEAAEDRESLAVGRTAWPVAHFHFARNPAAAYGSGSLKGPSEEEATAGQRDGPLGRRPFWLREGNFIMHLLQPRSGYRVNPG